MEESYDITIEKEMKSCNHHSLRFNKHNGRNNDGKKLQRTAFRSSTSLSLD